MNTQNKPFHLVAKPAGPDCNMNCTYCFYLEKKVFFDEKSSRRMSDELLEVYVKQYCQSQNTAELIFSWQGGEPTLLGIPFFEKAVELQKKYAGGRPVLNTIQTNGILIDSAWCRFLKKEEFLVGISLDGPRHIHDKYRVDPAGHPTFDRVMKAIKLMKVNRVEFNTLSCVTRQNAKYAVEIYDFLKGVGSKHLQFIPIVERKACSDALNPDLELAPPPLDGDDNDRVTAWTVLPDQFGRFMAEIFDVWVRRDVGTIFVQMFDVMLNAWMGMPPPLCVFAETCGDAIVLVHNGDIYSCDHFIYPEYLLGNLAETPLIDIAKKNQQSDFGDRKRDSLPKACRSCDFLFCCNGGCPKHRFSKTEDGETGGNWLCEGYKQFMHHIAPAMQAMARLLQDERPPSEIMKMMPPLPRK